MKKRLTYRQQQILSKFLDIYQEMAHSVHYIAFAERIGVSKVTAYEMLRLLEDHGLVQAEYHPNPDQHGPGRSVVLFYPTREGYQFIKDMSGSSEQSQDWEEAKEQILERLREGITGGYEELVSNLLDRIPEQRSPLIFATELITTLVLSLISIKDTPGIQSILDRLSRIGLPREIGLNVLSGVSMVLSVLEKTNRKSASMLLSQIGKFEEVITDLSEESKRKLSEYTREIIHLLTA